MSLGTLFVDEIPHPIDRIYLRDGKIMFEAALPGPLTLPQVSEFRVHDPQGGLVAVGPWTMTKHQAKVAASAHRGDCDDRVPAGDFGCAGLAQDIAKPPSPAGPTGRGLTQKRATKEEDDGMRLYHMSAGYLPGGEAEAEQLLRDHVAAAEDAGHTFDEADISYTDRDGVRRLFKRQVKD